MQRARSARGASATTAMLAAVGVVALFVLVFFRLGCPCERIPGGYLLGEAATEPVANWSFANDVRLCQIEVRGWIPHSVNLNCMASDGEHLYLSCSRCDGKRWSALALVNPEGRIRVGRTVYPVTLTRVKEPAELDEAWRARARKLGLPEGTPRPDHWWSFRVESR